MKQNHALVREPGTTFPRCITSLSNRNLINVSLARKQHHNYCKTLVELGLEVIHLPRDDERPDSCFVEDTTVIHNKKAFITRMGAKSRRGEELSVETVLKNYLKTKKAVTPATLEGGDVIHLSDRLICGVTQRTNTEGINQMEEWLGILVENWTDPNIVHLKSYITYLDNNFIIATETYATHPFLKDFSVLVVPSDESYAANTLTIDNTVLMPKYFPKTQTILRDAGFEVISLAMSEFQKCEGALTCLSLIF